MNLGQLPMQTVLAVNVASNLGLVSSLLTKQPQGYAQPLWLMVSTNWKQQKHLLNLAFQEQKIRKISKTTHLFYPIMLASGSSDFVPHILFDCDPPSIGCNSTPQLLQLCWASTGAIERAKGQTHSKFESNVSMRKCVFPQIHLKLKILN